MTDSITRQWVRSKADESAVDAGCVFDLAAADRVRTFFAKFLRHSKGSFGGQPFELLGWQWDSLLGPLYGWKRRDGSRRYRRSSTWISKKNGKSTLCAGLILYSLVADNEPGSEVYGAAADRAQASIIFEEVAAMVGQSPALAGRLDVNRTIKRVTFAERASFYQVLSRDSRRSGHGINAHVCVIDELHVVDRRLYDTLRYSGAARRQPLLVEISTAGDDKTSLGYERYCYAKQVREGTIEDPELLVYIAEADQPDRWQEQEQWKRANPSLGVTISLDSFKADFTEAKNGTPAAQANFKQLRLNLWQDAISAWLPVEEWDACAADITPEMLDGAPCWAGLDLSSKMDLTALALVFALDDGRYALLCRLWAPEEADSARQKANKALLRPWMLSGHITGTEGNVMDYAAVQAQVLADNEQYAIREVAFDPWNAQATANSLTEQGVSMVEFPQTIKSYNEPMQEMERLIKSRLLVHDGSPVMRWMFKNVCVRKDPSGNVRPDKAKSADKIDGIAAAMMALGRALLANAGTSDYGTEGILSI